LGAQPVTGVARDDSVTTTSVGGEALSGLSTSLDLTRNTMYDVSASLSAIQAGTTTVAASWSAESTITTANGIVFSSPRGMAIDSSGNIFICDRSRSRVVKLNSSGVYVSSASLNGNNFVCVDASGKVYVTSTTSTGDLYKYSNSLVLEDQATGSEFEGTLSGVATDDTHIYIATSNDVIIKALCSTLDWVATYGSSGSGNGQYNNPEGIVYNPDDGHLYVADAGNNRVQKITTAGVYVSQFATAAGTRGIDVDADGNLLLVNNTAGNFKRYTTVGALLDTTTQSSAYGIASVDANTAWVSVSSGSGSIVKWTYDAGSPGGYGEVAVSINGNVGTYLGIGNEVGLVENTHTQSVQGPASVTAAAYGKRTSSTLTLESAVLSAKAVPRR
jgi:DNA-binding beta-propeller fold protein YncE